MNKMIDYLTLNGLIKQIEPRILHVDSRAVRFRQKASKSTLRFTGGDISICGDALACKLFLAPRIFRAGHRPSKALLYSKAEVSCAIQPGIAAQREMAASSNSMGQKTSLQS